MGSDEKPQINLNKKQQTNMVKLQYDLIKIEKENYAISVQK